MLDLQMHLTPDGIVIHLSKSEHHGHWPNNESIVQEHNMCLQLAQKRTQQLLSSLFWYTDPRYQSLDSHMGHLTSTISLGHNKYSQTLRPQTIHMWNCRKLIVYKPFKTTKCITSKQISKHKYFNSGVSFKSNRVSYTFLGVLRSSTPVSSEGGVLKSIRKYRDAATKCYGLGRGKWSHGLNPTYVSQYHFNE